MKAKQWLLFVGDCHELGEALAKKPHHPTWLALRFLDALLRGYGEIVFANNPITGLLFVAGITVADPYVSLCGLTMGVVGLLAALATQQPRKAISAGLPLYCPILIGLVTSSLLPAVYGLEMNYRFWIYMIVGAIFSMYLTSALGTLFGSLARFPLLCFSVPFVIVQAMLFLCVVNSPYYPPKPLAAQNISIERIRRDIHAIHFNPETKNFHSNVTVSNPSNIDTLQDNLNFSFTDSEIPEDVTNSNASKTHILLTYPNANSTSSGLSADRTSPNVSNEDTFPSNHSSNLKDSELQSNSAFANDFETDTLSESSDFNHTDVEVFLHINSSHASGTGSFLANPSFNHTEVELLSNSSSHASKDATSLATDTITTGDRGGAVDSRNGSQSDTEDAIYNTTMDDVEYFHDPNHIDWGQVFTGVLLSMSQVFGVNSAPGAALMYLGMLIFSPTTGLMCFVGATVSTLTGLVFSVPPYTDVYQGVWGFNGLLCAGGLSGFCFVLTPQSAALGVMCALFSTCLQHVLNYSFAAVPMPVLSIPFNIAAILFMCVTTEDENTGLVRPDSFSFPERHRHEWKTKRKAAEKESLQQDECSLSGSCHEKEEEAEESRIAHEEV